jgi:hypothetical protein
VTPHDIEGELLRLTAVLEERTAEFAVLLRRAAEAEVAYKIGYAQSLLMADGTVQARESRATLDTAGLLEDRRIAEALAESCRESIRSTRTQLDAVRSISASVRSAMELT